MVDLIVRAAAPSDARDILAIYAQIVERTAISFETEVPSEETIKARIFEVSARYPYLVCHCDGHFAGYAYANLFRSRPAYASTAETTAYVREDFRGKGVGTALYEALLAKLSGAGIHCAVAAITLPNPASVALHERCGFEPVGVLREVGRKFGVFHDVGWWQRHLSSNGETMSFHQSRPDQTGDQ
ncbi:MAG: N-acetyltransferase family protein [Pseudomonadota bacterium]